MKRLHILFTGFPLIFFLLLALNSYSWGETRDLVILAFGDSITYGIGSSSNGPGTGYPFLLEIQLETGLDVNVTSINAGIPGEDTFNGLGRFRNTLNLYKPDLVLLMEGTNDCVYNIPFDDMENNLRSMIQIATDQGIPVIIATIPPVITNEYIDRSGQQANIQAFNPRIYAIAADYNIRVAQVYETITSVPGWENNLMDQFSGNHPNDEGYQMIRNAFSFQIFNLLSRGAPAIVATNSPAEVARKSATLSAIINPNGLATTYYFQWGPTAAFGNKTVSQSAGNGTDNVAINAYLSGLTFNTTYHYSLVASNSAGTSYGPNMIFKTLLPSPGDYDGDGKTDIAVWRPGDGNWHIRNSEAGTVTAQQWGAGAFNDWPVASDYDGDGKIDYGVWRPGDGMWYILRSSDGGVTATLWGAGTLSDVPVPGDYDGDGKTDMAVWRPGDGNWYILRSSDGGVTATQWGAGALNDVPVPGDYDGDGTTDIAVWRPGDGNWYIPRSSDGGVTVTQWGTGTLFAKSDIPVPGDYDGDGKTDMAVWRPGDGNWYILRSSDGGVTATQWGAGALNDVPVPGDYDGDGTTDIAVWRPGDGMWYILRSSDGGVTATQWGSGDLNDEPIAGNSLIYRYLEGSLY